MSPRWYYRGEYLPLDTGGGPLARLWSTALANMVKTRYVQATGNSVRIQLPRSAELPEMEFEWKVPQWSNTIERDRARAYFIGYAAAMALHFYEQAMNEIRNGRTKTFQDFDVPEDAIGCGFHEAVRGVLSHHLVIRDRKIANYHPYPPTPWNASPRDSFGTPGPYEDAVQGMRIFEENGRDNFKGIDIMRTVRSFDPCLPCGVHMYLGTEKPSGRFTRRCSEGKPDEWRCRCPRNRPARRSSPRSGRAHPGGAPRTGARCASGAARLYGAAFERVLTRLSEPDSTVTPVALAADELIGHLLLVHGLHPLGFRELEEVPGAPGGPTLVQLDAGHGLRSGR